MATKLFCDSCSNEIKLGPMDDGCGGQRYEPRRRTELDLCSSCRQLLASLVAERLPHLLRPERCALARSPQAKNTSDETNVTTDQVKLSTTDSLRHEQNRILSLSPTGLIYELAKLAAKRHVEHAPALWGGEAMISEAYRKALQAILPAPENEE